MKLLTMLLPLAFIVACGGSEPAAKAPSADAATEKAPAKPGPRPEPKPEPEPEPEIVVDDGTVVTINLTGSDAMQYNAATIEIKAGRTVKLNFKHVGKMPADMMGHNFVLLTAGTDPAAFAAAGVTAKDTDYIAAAMNDKVIAKTKMIGGGESDSIEFAAPAAGEYDFLCTFPGHSAMMKGKLIVT